MADLEVYVKDGTKKPQPTGASVERLPATYTHNGTVYYFAFADISQRFVIFTDCRPEGSRWS